MRSTTVNSSNFIYPYIILQLCKYIRLHSVELSDDLCIEFPYWQFPAGAEKSHEDTQLWLSASKSTSGAILDSCRYTSPLGDRSCHMIHYRSSHSKAIHIFIGTVLKKLLIYLGCYQFDCLWQKSKWIAWAAEWCEVAVKQSPCKIWVSHGIIPEDGSLLWCDSELSGKGSCIFWMIAYVSSSGSSSPFCLVCVTLKTEALCIFRMLGTLCPVACCHIVEDLNFQSHFIFIVPCIVTVLLNN